MSPAETAFLERAVVQLLFVSGRTFSLEGLRDKLRELFLPHPEPTVRAAASVGGFELVQTLLKASGRLGSRSPPRPPGATRPDTL